MAKPRKVKEPTTSYTAKPKKPTTQAGVKSGERGARVADEDAFRKAADKVFRVHRELLRKLAQ